MSDSPRSGEWRLQRYRPGDETEILALFTDVFRRPRSLQHWTWQFQRNPYGGPFATTARRVDDGAVVGIYGVMPMRLNVVGNPVPACQSVDTAVHPDHRGQRIFEKTASDCYEWCRSEGLQAIIGFPNAISYPGLVRSLGWSRVLFPTQHKQHLRIREALEQSLRVPLLPLIADVLYRAYIGIRLSFRHAAVTRSAGPGLRYSEGDAVPAGYQALWNAWRSQEVLSVWKDTDYLRWRYDENPDHRFRYHHLERGGELVAMAVTVEIHAETIVCELFVRGRDVPVGRRLVSELCRYALERGHQAVSFLGHDAGFFDDAFQGFARRHSYANVLCALAWSTGELGELLPHADNWTLTYGDGDFV